MRLLLTLVLSLVLLACKPAGAYTPQHLVTLGQDWVVCVAGDSRTFIGTNGGGTGWIDQLQSFVNTYQPQYNIKFVNCGVSGNTSTDLANRFYSTVLNHLPNLTIIFIGVNDIGKTGGNPNWTVYANNVQFMIDACKSQGSQVLLFNEAWYGEKRNGQNPYDAQMDYLSWSVLPYLSNKNAVSLADMRSFSLGVDLQYNPNDLASGIATSDQLHENQFGHDQWAGASEIWLGLR